MRRGNSASLSSIQPSQYGGKHFSSPQNHLPPYTHIDFIHGRFIPRPFILRSANLGRTANGCLLSLFGFGWRFRGACKRTLSLLNERGRWAASQIHQKLGRPQTAEILAIMNAVLFFACSFKYSASSRGHEHFGL